MIALRDDYLMTMITLMLIIKLWYVNDIICLWSCDDCDNLLIFICSSVFVFQLASVCKNPGKLVHPKDCPKVLSYQRGLHCHDFHLLGVCSPEVFPWEARHHGISPELLQHLRTCPPSFLPHSVPPDLRQFKIHDFCMEMTTPGLPTFQVRSDGHATISR